MLRATAGVIQPFENQSLRNLLGECLALTYNAIHYVEQKGIMKRRGTGRRP
jgi:hypothetical protein